MQITLAGFDMAVARENGKICKPNQAWAQSSDCCAAFAIDSFRLPHHTMHANFWPEAVRQVAMLHLLRAGRMTPFADLFFSGQAERACHSKA